MNGRDEEEKGLLWKLPAVKSKQLGSLDLPLALALAAGLVSPSGSLEGTGFGPGIPGLQLGFGLGAGCGVGLGFGYGVGRGIAYDENRRYTNVGKFFHNRGDFPVQHEIGALVDDLVLSAKKLIQATSREVDKWRRY
ncbi:UNVERIFIED_CONTAM: hypothetical protein Slati_2270100 [Sesamum latifolium]|uniref:Glycine-rich protein n=1 Tax=Sesamum latifolium TaxID=2727402 RepID=A0AAW2W9C4_9LAMI